MSSYKKDFKKYLADLPKRQPSPGGGSAVCLMFCLGISLMDKAINYSIVKKAKTAKEKAQNIKLKKSKASLESLSRKVYPYIDKDSQLFGKIMAAKGKKRLEFIKMSEELICDVAESAQKAFFLAKGIESGIKKSIISDFYIGLEAVRISLLGCILNLEANSSIFKTNSKNIRTFKKVLKKWQ